MSGHARIAVAMVTLLVSTATFAKPRFITPQQNTSISGTTVHISLKGCKKTPNLYAYYGDGYEVVKAKPHHYKKSWVAQVELPRKGKYELSLEGYCGRKKFKHKVEVTAGARPAAIATDVAMNFMASKKNRPEKLKWDWVPAIMLHGMTRIITQSPEKEKLLGYVTDYFRHYMKKGVPKIDWADRCPSALSAFTLSQEFGNDIAWPAIDEVAHFIKTAERNKLGSLDHFGNDTFMAKIFPGSIWVDSLMMWGLIALQYGLHTGDKELTDFALNQPLIFARKMQNQTNGLFYHAWNVDKDRPYPKGGTFWLRGNGWVAASFIDILEMMPKDDHRYPHILNSFKALMTGARRTIMPGNLWDTVMNSPGYAYEETSGSALLAYAFAKGARLGYLPESDASLAADVFDSISARLKPTKKGKSMPDISWLTMPYTPFIYKILPKKKDLAYGLGAFFLLAGEMENHL